MYILLTGFVTSHDHIFSVLTIVFSRKLALTNVHFRSCTVHLIHQDRHPFKHTAGSFIQVILVGWNSTSYIHSGTMHGVTYNPENREPNYNERLAIRGPVNPVELENSAIYYHRRMLIQPTKDGNFFLPYCDLVAILFSIVPRVPIIINNKPFPTGDNSCRSLAL